MIILTLALVATLMLGGGALYLLAHVAFRWRNILTLNRQRLLCALLLCALLGGELAVRPPSLVTLGALMTRNGGEVVGSY